VQELEKDPGELGSKARLAKLYEGRSPEVGNQPSMCSVDEPARRRSQSPRLPTGEVSFPPGPDVNRPNKRFEFQIFAFGKSAPKSRGVTFRSADAPISEIFRSSPSTLGLITYHGVN